MGKIFEGFIFDEDQRSRDLFLTPSGETISLIGDQKPLPKIKGFDQDLCTILIETQYMAKKDKGTGFMGYIDDPHASDDIPKYGRQTKRYYFPYNFSGAVLPFLITNRHVLSRGIKEENEKKEEKGDQYVSLEDSDEVVLTLRFMDEQTSSKVWQGKITLPYSYVKEHLTFADDDVDLVIFNMHHMFDEIYSHYEPEDRPIPYYYGIDLRSSFKKGLKDFKTGSPVVLYGYPYGLDDDGNYLPMARFGHCACNPQIQNKVFFKVDIASHPGQSGSPVFWHEQELRGVDDDGATFFYAYRTNLLGVFTSGHLRGQNESYPIHLGEVIKIEYLEKLVEKYFRSEQIKEHGEERVLAAEEKHKNVIEWMEYNKDPIREGVKKKMTEIINIRGMP